MMRTISKRTASQAGALVATVVLASLVSAMFSPRAAAKPADEPQARLLALAHDIAGNRELLVRVDQSTGAFSVASDGIPNCCTSSVLDGALDAAGGKYYAVMTAGGETAPRVVVFDTQSGAATTSPPLAGVGAINYLAYDETVDQLLAISFITGTLTAQVVHLDPATGAATVLNPAITDCCSPIAYDAAYNAGERRLYIAVSFYAGAGEPRLLTISGNNGAVLASAPLDPGYDVNHLAYDSAGDALWAVVYDKQNDAERLAQINRMTGALTPFGKGVAACCARLVTDAALNLQAGVLVAPMIDISDPETDDAARFYRFALADGFLLGSPLVDPSYNLHYLVFEPPQAQATTTPTATPSATAPPTATKTPALTPTPTITPTPLPPKLYLPAINGQA